MKLRPLGKPINPPTPYKTGVGGLRYTLFLFPDQRPRINAKHSNEDQIAPFPEWVKRYGDRIGNFGGIDLDVVCNASKQEMREYIQDVIKQSFGHGGFAFGSGNSIPDYVPASGYLDMIQIVREIRGDFKS